MRIHRDKDRRSQEPNGQAPADEFPRTATIDKFIAIARELQLSADDEKILDEFEAELRALAASTQAVQAQQAELRRLQAELIALVTASAGNALDEDQNALLDTLGREFARFLENRLSTQRTANEGLSIPGKQLLSAEEFGQCLGVSKSYVNEHIKSGDLPEPNVRVPGKGKRYTLGQLEEVVQRFTHNPPRRRRRKAPSAHGQGAG